MHRVQRVPVTESQGRIHTSAAGVLVLPEAEDVEVADRPQRPAHRRLPVVRPGRAERQHHRLGGAHHAPADRHRRRPARTRSPSCRTRSRRCASCGPGCSPRRRRRPTRRRRDARRSQVRTVDRSERVRTYNFPENRIADHRVDFKALQPRPGARRRPRRGGPGAGRRRHRGPARRRDRLRPVASTERCGPPLRSCAAAASWPRRACPSPRFDAEELAAHSLGVRAPRPAGAATGVGPEFAAYVRAAGRPRAAAAHHRPGVLPPPRPRGRARACSCRGRRPRCVVERGRLGRARAASSRPPVVVDLVHRVGRHRARGRRRGARCAGCTPSRPTRRAHAWAARNAAGHGRRPAPRRHGRRVPRPGRHGRRRGQQPAVHPGRRRGARPGGGDARPGAGAVVGGGRAGRGPGRRAGRRAAAAGRAAPWWSSTRTCRASRRRRCSPPTGRWRDVADHRDLAGRDRYLTATEDRSRLMAAWIRRVRHVARPGRAAASGSSGPTDAGRAAASWSCSRPTRSTASAPTRSARDAVGALLAAKGRGRTCRCRCSSGRRAPSTASRPARRPRRGRWSRRSGRAG